MTFGSPKGGGNAYTIGRVFGIPLRVQPMFLVLVGLFTFLGGMSASQNGGSGTAGALGMLVILAIVAVSVVLHELGHALTARRYGIEVIDITLWPLGGVAMLRGMPEDAKIEGVVSIMGPAVNFAIAALVAPLLLLTEFSDIGLTNALRNPLGVVVLANLMLGGFNLLPAFPMDGGKILRAFLARNGDWLGATERAVKVGRWFAIAMIIFGLIPPMNVILSLIGLFVISAGTRELWHVRARHGGGGAFAGSIANLMRMAAEMQRSKAGAPDPEQGPTAGPVHDVPGSSAQTGGGSGFSDDDVQRLEGFHGRLQRPDSE